MGSFFILSYKWAIFFCNAWCGFCRVVIFRYAIFCVTIDMSQSSRNALFLLHPYQDTAHRPPAVSFGHSVWCFYISDFGLFIFWMLNGSFRLLQVALLSWYISDHHPRIPGRVFCVSGSVTLQDSRVAISMCPSYRNPLRYFRIVIG